MSTFQLKFEVFKAGSLIKQEILFQEAIKIGRTPGCHLLIDDEDISGTHAVIEVAGVGQIFINDLGSMNGTKVNGQPVGRASLNNGDVITLGSVDIRMSIMAAVAQAQAPNAIPVSQAMPMQSPMSADFSGQTMLGAGAPQMSPMANYGQPQVGFASPSVPPARISAPPMGMGAGIPVQSQMSYPVGAVDLSSVEDTSRQSTEVVVLWNGSVLKVNHYMPDEKKPINFYIGEDPVCDFPIPPEVLNGSTKCALVVNSLGGSSTVTILPNAQGDISFEDGSRMSLQDAISSGRVSSSSEVPGGFAFNLVSKSRVKMDIGPWTFLVNSVPCPRKFVAPMEFDWSSQIYTGFSLILHSIFLALVYFIPPAPEGLSLDLLAENNRFIKYMLTPPEVVQDEVPEWLKKDKEDEQQGGKGKRHKGEEGQMGKRDSKKTDNHYGIKGPKDNPDPHMARSMAKEMAKNAGILSYLSAANAPTSPFGRDTALGVDPENALGALMGNQVGENFGYGGLGLRGTGRGGGGTGEGTIGLGNLKSENPTHSSASS